MPALVNVGAPNAVSENFLEECIDCPFQLIE